MVGTYTPLARFRGQEFESECKVKVLGLVNLDPWTSGWARIVSQGHVVIRIFSSNLLILGGAVVALFGKIVVLKTGIL